MNTGTKVGLGIGLLGLLYAFTRKKFDIVIQRTYNTASGSKGIEFKACIYDECLNGIYVMDWVPKVIPFEKNPGYFLVLQGVPPFNEIRVGIGRKDATGAITADYLRVVDFNTVTAKIGAVSRFKVYNLDTEKDSDYQKYQRLMQTDSPLFLEVEKIFDNWIENAPSEYEDMYFSDEAIYYKKGAIRGAIEQIFEVMNEYNLPFIYLDDKRLDLEAAFT